MKITFELTEDEKKVLNILIEQGASFRGVSDTYFYKFEDSIKKFEEAGLVVKCDTGMHDLGGDYKLTSLGCFLTESTTITF
jgi:hypothetical protein